MKWFTRAVNRRKTYPKNHYGIPSIDDLYEVEDFLRNTGEKYRADRIRNARITMKIYLDLIYQFSELAEELDWFDGLKDFDALRAFLENCDADDVRQANREKARKKA